MVRNPSLVLVFKCYPVLECSGRPLYLPLKVIIFSFTNVVCGGVFRRSCVAFLWTFFEKKIWLMEVCTQSFTLGIVLA